MGVDGQNQVMQAGLEQPLEELRALPGSGPFGPAERPMGGYLSLPHDLSDEAKTAWVDRARELLREALVTGRVGSG